MVLLVVLGLAQLVQLWLNTLTGNRPPTLLFLVPVPISALLWPWVFVALQECASVLPFIDPPRAAHPVKSLLFCVGLCRSARAVP